MLIREEVASSPAVLPMGTAPQPPLPTAAAAGGGWLAGAAATCNFATLI